MSPAIVALGQTPKSWTWSSRIRSYALLFITYFWEATARRNIELSNSSWQSLYLLHGIHTLWSWETITLCTTVSGYPCNLLHLPLRDYKAANLWVVHVRKDIMYLVIVVLVILYCCYGNGYQTHTMQWHMCKSWAGLCKSNSFWIWLLFYTGAVW